AIRRAFRPGVTADFTQATGGTMARSSAVDGAFGADPQPQRDALTELDDSGLVAAFLDGQKRAFNVLVDRYQTRLLNFVYRTTGDRERAEDLVQETFIRVYRHLHRFDQSKKFSTWIYTIASNLAKN